MTERNIEPDTQYKVGRVLSEYGLLDLHDELPRRWTGEAGEAMSLRELADHINVALVSQAMTDAGEEPLAGEAENAYRLLTADDVSAGVRTQQRNRLERAGVDVDELESRFVTHQAVHTYLTTGLGISKDSAESEPVEKHEERIQRLRSRTVAVVENSLSELRESGEITTGEFDVSVDIQIYCRTCNTQVPLADFLDGSGCECD